MVDSLGQKKAKKESLNLLQGLPSIGDHRSKYHITSNQTQETLNKRWLTVVEMS